MCVPDAWTGSETASHEEPGVLNGPFSQGPWHRPKSEGSSHCHCHQEGLLALSIPITLETVSGSSISDSQRPKYWHSPRYMDRRGHLSFDFLDLPLGEEETLSDAARMPVSPPGWLGRTGKLPLPNAFQPAKESLFFATFCKLVLWRPPFLTSPLCWKTVFLLTAHDFQELDPHFVQTANSYTWDMCAWRV